MANEYLQRTPTSTGNRKVWTWAGWVKRSNTAETNILFEATTDGTSNRSLLRYNSTSDFLELNDSASGANVTLSTKSRRDSSSWIHIMRVLDTPSGKDSVYVNGVLDFTRTATTNADGLLNGSGVPHFIGHTTVFSQDFKGEMFDVFLVDGQALTPDVFGFYKDGNGYISAGSTQATDFRPGQWVPKTPRVIKAQIERNGGFGVNGFYLPMNDSKNFGADFHCEPNSIITLKGEDLPQPRNGAPETTDAYVSQLRTDPYAANLVLAVPGIIGAPGVAYTDFSANIKGSGTNKVITANGAAGVAVTASYYGSAMEFTGVAGTYFSGPTNDSDFQPGSGDFTVEAWVYPTSYGANEGIVGVWESSAGRSWLLYNNSTLKPTIIIDGDGAGGGEFEALSGIGITTGQWTHLAGERNGSTLSIYVNGVATGIVTNVSGSVYTNTSNPLDIGRFNSANEFEGYIQDLRVYKGVAKYTGGFDVPRPYTPVGIATWRAVPDTTANNFATMNPLIGATPRFGGTVTSTIVTYTDGNLTNRNSANSGFAPAMQSHSNVGMTTGKWYWEVSNFSTTTNEIFGISKGNEQGSPTGSGVGIESLISFNSPSGTIYIGEQSDTTGSITPASGTISNVPGNPISSTSDVVGFAFDATNSSLSVYLNGILNNTVTNIVPTQRSVGLAWVASKTASSSGSASGMSWNFGQNPTFSGNTTAGTFTDSNSKGLFKYEPPSGFLALCEDNLPTPAISNPGEYFKTVLYTGDGSSGRSITGVGFKPDLVWFKARNNSASHVLNDTVRGITEHLNSDGTAAASTPTYPYLNSVDNNGFSLLGGSSSGGNIDGRTYVAWCWRAGAGTTSTNTDGSITSVVSVNQTAGFSIVSYTGTGANATVGHGLGKAPSMIICKSRDAVDTWPVWHQSLASPTNNYLVLESTAGVGTITNYWNSSAPNATTFGVAGGGYAHNLSGDKQIAYCWAEVEGFSKAFSYVGNGSADGPFVYCGFKPALVLIKTTSGGSWVIKDSSRSPNNPNGSQLYANTSAIDDDPYGITDFLSNGFKPRVISQSVNASGETYIGFAWAESPFQTANSK
jgi:hypothetical protein